KVRYRWCVFCQGVPLDVVEGAVLSNDDDEVFDRGLGGDVLARIVVTGDVRGERERWPRLECEEAGESGGGEAMGPWSFHEQTSVKKKAKTDRSPQPLPRSLSSGGHAVRLSP